jgi:hypothetical protein
MAAERSASAIGGRSETETLFHLFEYMSDLETEFELRSLNPRTRRAFYAIFMEGIRRSVVTLNDLGGARHALGSRPALNAALRDLVDLALVRVEVSGRDARKNSLILTDRGMSFFRMLSEGARDLYAGAGAASMTSGHGARPGAAPASVNPKTEALEAHEVHRPHEPHVSHESLESLKSPRISRNP